MLEQIVSVAVSDLADFVTCHESFFLQMIGKRQSAGKDRNIRSVKSDIAAGKHRIDEIDRLIAKLYEDNFAGKLSDERYSRMAAKYEKEQAELLQSVSTKEKELVELERESVDIRLLLAGLREYSSMETLTPEVVNKIIKRIEVHNSETVNGHKRVGIDIYFTGVGLVDLRKRKGRSLHNRGCDQSLIRKYFLMNGKRCIKRFSSIEKCHRNSIKITVALWCR